MLILIKTSIRTTVVLLLFAIGSSQSLAGNRFITDEIREANPVISGDTVVTGQEGLTKQINPDVKGVVPDSLSDKTIDFQVNSYISYLSLNHFMKSEAKNLFLQALLKERQTRSLSAQTDSLRKVYANSSIDQREDIAARILKAEEQSLILNKEIPELYEKARTEENSYWQSASADEIVGFQEKIRLFRDSVQQVADLKSKQTAIIEEKISDTITFYPAVLKPEAKAEAPSEIIYKIQIGAYKGKTPEPAARLIKKLSIIRQVDNHKDEKGVNVYTTGNLKSYQEAVTMQNQVKQEGVKNATIAAYQNGKRITLDEARKINNETKVPLK